MILFVKGSYQTPSWASCCRASCALHKFLVPCSAHIIASSNSLYAISEVCSLLEWCNECLRLLWTAQVWLMRFAQEEINLIHHLQALSSSISTISKHFKGGLMGLWPNPWMIWASSALSSRFLTVAIAMTLHPPCMDPPLDLPLGWAWIKARQTIYSHLYCSASGNPNVS